jgi:hypothetical protein
MSGLDTEFAEVFLPPRRRGAEDFLGLKRMQKKLCASASLW